jgi:hypothetical protein
MKKFLSSLIRNNTGVSSKSFFLVVVTIIGCALLVVVGFVMVYEILCNGTIASDINGLAQIILAVSGIFASVGLTKSVSEFNEFRHRYKDVMPPAVPDEDDC